MKDCPRCGRPTPGGKVCPKCLVGFVVQSEESEPRMSENEFINLAIQKKVATFEQIDDCRNDPGGDPVWEVLLRKGFASAEQVEALLAGRDPVKVFRFGEYEILSKIGEGGMGTVYKAKQGRRTVALKVLPDKFANSKQVKRFEREARIAIALSHPNLVKGYEHGQIKGRWYYAMEFVQGKELSTLVEERSRLDERAALNVAIQVAGALEAIDGAGLAHRDIKPDNIIMGEDGVAKVMDLGLVKSTTEDREALTQDGHTMGTMHYMSPEQAQGKLADIRSDIYSLGATLFTMVTGRKPFDHGRTPMEIMRLQAAGRHQDPRRYNADLSDGVCILIENMMACDAAARYARPAELVRDMRAVLDGRSPSRGRPARRATMRKTAPPSRLPWVLGGVAAAVVGVVVAFVLMQEPPSKPPPAKKTTRKKPGPDIEKRFKETLAAGRLANASEILRRDAAKLGGGKMLELQAMLEEAAERRWAVHEDRIERFVQEEDFEAARRAIEKLRPDLRAVKGMTAKLDARAEEVDEAERTAIARAEEDPLKLAEEKWSGLEQAIALKVANEDYAGAIGVLQGARVLNQDDPYLTRLIDRRIGELEALASKPVPKVEPKPEPDPAPVPKEEDLLATATLQFKDGDDDGALATLREQLQRNPDDARAHGLAAHCYYRKGDFATAQDSATRALLVNKAEPHASFVVGMTHLGAGRYEIAETWLTRALSGGIDANMPRARARAELKKWEGVLIDLDAAGSSNRALRLAALEGLERIDEAIELVSKWIKEEPKSPAPWIRRGHFYMAAGEFRKAKSDYSRALRYDKKNEVALAGKKAAEVALNPRAGKLRSGDIRKILQDRFHARTEKFTPRQDGNVEASFVYDFSKEEQLEDFAAAGTRHENRTLILQGADAGGLVLKAKFIGNFFIRADFVLFGDPGDFRTLGIRTVSSPDASASLPGVGSGIFPQNGAQMIVGVVGQEEQIAQPKSVPLQRNSQTYTTLKREGEMFTAGFAGRVNVQGRAPGYERVYLRFYAAAPVRLTRIEITGRLDPDWLEPILHPGKDRTNLFVGTYDVIGNEKIDVTVERREEGLYFIVPGQDSYLMEPQGSSRFSIGNGYFVEFDVENGEVGAARIINPDRPATELKPR